MTEPGETDDYTATDHIRAIFDHTEYGIFQYVILNKRRLFSDLQKTYTDQSSYPVRYKIDEIRDFGLTSIVADVVSERRNKIRHDDDKLGKLLMELIQ